MANYTYQDILVADLLVNIENPRYEVVSNQRESIETILDDQEDKIYRLADDIVNEGPNPSELPIITQDKSNIKKYVVLEGNRRVTSIKLLINPELADEKYKVIRSARFRKLADRFSENPITKLRCVVFANAEDANRWIRLRHTGENEGVGTARWDAHQVARFDAKVSGKTTASLQIIDFLRQSDTFDKGLQADLSHVNLSTLERLISSADVKKFLGIGTKNGKLFSEIDNKELEKGFTKIIDDLLNHGLAAREIDNKGDRKRYVEKFPKEFTPDKARRTTTSWELITPGEAIVIEKQPETTSPDTQPPTNKPTNAAKKKTSLPLSTDREVLIPPKTCVLKISNARTNKIYDELKKLVIADYENATGVLFRVFIELSTHPYLDKFPVGGLNPKSYLKDKVVKVTEHMVDNNFASEAKMKGIKTAAKDTNNIMSIGTFNAYVHNIHFSPDALALKKAWDNIQPYVETIWENV